MKGVVFTVFLEMVENQFTPEVADRILDALPEGCSGAYTAVGNYSHDEMISLVVSLGKETDIPVPDLIQAYGRHLLGEFKTMYPVFFKDVDNAFDFLASVDSHIHQEVKKLYSDAELPKFETVVHRQGQRAVGIDMRYMSSRPFAQLAYGLIEGALEHWGHKAEIEMIDRSTPDQTIADFTVREVALVAA